MPKNTYKKASFPLIVTVLNGFYNRVETSDIDPRRLYTSWYKMSKTIQG